MRRFLITLVLGSIVWVARGEWYGFSAITSNDPGGLAPAAGEKQFYLNLSPLDAGQASLVITNTGPEPSSISGLYFDSAPALNLSLQAIYNGNGVSFGIGKRHPGNLPGGKVLANAFIADLSISADQPVPFNGINPYESLELLMHYDAGFDLFDALTNEDLRIGLHVQSLAGGYSESFINNPVHQDAIPEPGTLSMLLIGGIVLRWLRIR